MGSNEGSSVAIPIDAVESPLLCSAESDPEDQDEDEEVLYAASFEGMEEKVIHYETALWVLYSLLLIPAWGIGIFMLLYIPFRIRIARKHILSKKLYLTPDAVVYKASAPVPMPCFGHLKLQKHVLLPSVADVVVEQGYIQSYFGVYSIRIEHKGVRRPAGDDVTIQGLALPSDFQKAVLTQISSIRNEQLGKLASTSTSSVLPSADLILQKLDEVEGSLKKVHGLIETRANASQMCD